MCSTSELSVILFFDNSERLFLISTKKLTTIVETVFVECICNFYLVQLEINKYVKVKCQEKFSNVLMVVN